MPATVTLSTTTLTNGVGPSDTRIKVAATAGMLTGYRLYLDGELMQVISLDVDPWVNVKRGVDNTSGLSHASGSTIYIGRADHFYSQDPVGRPASAILVSPYINVSNGSVWFAQGDAEPSNSSNRWWVRQTVTYGVGALGVRTTTLNLESST